METEKTRGCVLTEIPALPQAFLCFVQISPLVTSGKAIPAGQRGEGGGKIERMK